MFKTHYNTDQFPKHPEVPYGDKLVETAGYIPAKARIENLILAGQRLAAYRSEQYDFESLDSVDEDFGDPTRSKGFDMADAFQINEKLKIKRKSQNETKTLENTENTTKESPQLSEKKVEG